MSNEHRQTAQEIRKLPKLTISFHIILSPVLAHALGHFGRDRKRAPVLRLMLSDEAFSKMDESRSRGVAAPEAANNAGAQISFVPLLTLGVPSNAIMAVMAGAMTIKGVIPRGRR